MVHTDPKELREYKIDCQAVCKGKEKYRTEVGLCKMAIWSLLLDPNCICFDAFSKYLGFKSDLGI